MIADDLSRTKIFLSVWILDKDSFLWVLGQGLTPEVDLCTMREKPTLGVRVSSECHYGIYMGCFLISWDHWKITYLFPLSSHTLKVWTLLKSFHGRGIVVTPSCPVNRSIKFFFPG